MRRVVFGKLALLPPQPVHTTPLQSIENHVKPVSRGRSVHLLQPDNVRVRQRHHGAALPLDHPVGGRRILDSIQVDLHLIIGKSENKKIKT